MNIQEYRFLSYEFIRDKNKGGYMKPIGVILGAAISFSVGADVISLSEKDLHTHDFTQLVSYSKDGFVFFKPEDFTIGDMKPDKALAIIGKSDAAGRYNGVTVYFSKEDFSKIRDAISSKFREITADDNFALYDSGKNLITVSINESDTEKRLPACTIVTITKKTKE